MDHYLKKKKKRQTAFQNCISACVSFSPSVRPLASLSPPSNGGCCDAKCHSPPRAPGPKCEVCDRWSSFSKLCPGHLGCIRPTSFTLQVHVFNLTSKRVKEWLEDGWELFWLCRRTLCVCVFPCLCMCVCLFLYLLQSSTILILLAN